MKLKMSQSLLIIIILVQIILIDSVLIFSFAKKIYTMPKKDKAVVTATNGKQIKSFNVVKKTDEYPFSKVFRENNRYKNESLRRIYEVVDYKTGHIMDFKIQEIKSDKKEFIATAYDLSYQSTGKYPSHKEYGITFSGNKAVKGRTIAVDPDIIPLGSKVYIEFPKGYSSLNGWYVAEDTGIKVKGRVIDIFLGEHAYKEAMNFGRRSIKVKIIYSINP